MMDSVHSDQAFEDSGRFLFGLAYRLLGTRAEAEDVVQDTYLKWRDADRTALANPRAWLTSVCTRHCLDVLRSAQRTRMEYVGTWLPEPIQGLDERTPELAVEISSSLSTAFLLLLERLAPKERAAYLLHDIFELDYGDIATMLEVNEAACRKLVSRARDSVGRERSDYAPARERQSLLLDAFRHAIGDGAIDPLARLLADEVTLCADGGGKVPTLRETLHGRAAVLAFIVGPLREYWQAYEWHETELNGACGVMLRDGNEAVATLSLAWDAQGCVAAFYIVRNPDKLAGLLPL